ncbi:MAG: ATP-binding cassette domain-containing protein [Bdellovibrionales bacterium]|nr:ATP-binding cassette domain-containing protein [Bdellovibrionales bacterium]
MLRVQSVSKSFDRSLVLDRLSFEIAPGELVGLVGPSNGGKSVLLKILGGVMSPDSGVVEGSGSRTGFLFQEGALFDSLSVLENVMFPLREARQGLSRTEMQRRAYEVLGEVGLGDHYQKVPGQLSGGMRRRVALARAIVARPELVLLDDPTGGLDPVAASVILALIRSVHAEYRPSVVIVSHDIRRLLPNVERVLCLFNHRIAVDCRPDELPERAPAQVLAFLRTRYDFQTAA